MSRITAAGQPKQAVAGNQTGSAQKAAAPAQLYLFTTKTCPNCRSAKEFLRGWDYQIIDAEEHPELAEKFSIMQAPTLVIVRDGLVQKFANASNIRKFVEQEPAETAKA